MRTKIPYHWKDKAADVIVATHTDQHKMVRDIRRKAGFADDPASEMSELSFTPWAANVAARVINRQDELDDEPTPWPDDVAFDQFDDIVNQMLDDDRDDDSHTGNRQLETVRPESVTRAVLRELDSVETAVLALTYGLGRKRRRGQQLADTLNVERHLADAYAEQTRTKMKPVLKRCRSTSSNLGWPNDPQLEDLVELGIRTAASTGIQISLL